MYFKYFDSITAKKKKQKQIHRNHFELGCSELWVVVSRDVVCVTGMMRANKWPTPRRLQKNERLPLWACRHVCGRGVVTDTQFVG